MWLLYVDWTCGLTHLALQFRLLPVLKDPFGKLWVASALSICPPQPLRLF